MRPQDRFEITDCDLKCVSNDCLCYIRYESLKNDKNIHIKGLKNDNFWYEKVSKWSINGS